jgi:hypothetical protein
VEAQIVVAFFFWLFAFVAEHGWGRS